MEKLTTEVFAERLYAVDKNLEVVSEYISYHDDITCRCKIDGNEWTAKACHFLDKSTTCSVCRQRNNSQRLTYKDVEQRINQKNKYIEIINGYINDKTPLDLYCKKHDYYFSKRIPTKDSTSLLCDLCNFEVGKGNYKLSDEVYSKILEVDNCQFISSYSKDKKVFLSYICNNHIERGIQNDLLINIKRRKNICQFCNGKIKDEEMFVERLHEIQPNIDLVGNYIAARERVHVICNTCGNEWNPFAYNLLSGFGCSSCNVSKGENEIKKYLDSYDINYIQHYKLLKGKGTSYLSLDFYLHDYNIGIEYDGEQHFHPVNWDGKTPEDIVTKRFETQKYNDQLKNDYCKNNRIELIRISYLEKDNIDNILDLKLNKLLTSNSA